MHAKYWFTPVSFFCAVKVMERGSETGQNNTHFFSKMCQSDAFLNTVSRLKEMFSSLYFLILFILFHLVLGAPWLLLYVLWRVAIVSARRFLPGAGKHFADKDVFFLEDYNGRHTGSIVVMMTLEGDVGLGAIRDRFTKTVLQARLDDKSGSSKLKFPELTQITTSFLGYPFWKDDPKFEIENHIHEVVHSGTTTADLPSYFQSFEKMVTEFTGRPYPPGRSPWEFYIVRKFQAVGEGPLVTTVLIWRAHHLLMDGFSMVSLLNTFLGHEAPAPAPPPGADDGPRRLINTLETTTPAGCSKWSLVWSLSNGFRQLLSQVGPNRRIQSSLCDARKKLEPPPVVRDHHVIHYRYSSPLPLHQLKAISAHFDVRLSALLTALLLESISNVIQITDNEVVDDDEGVVAALYVCPLPNHPGTLTNHAFFSTLEVPLSRGVPITEKLAFINESYLGLASNPVNGFLHYGAYLLGKLPRPIYNIFVSQQLYSPLNISNFSMGNNISQGFQLEGLECTDIRAGMGASSKLSGSIAIILGYKDHVRVLFGGHDSLFSEEQVERIAVGIGENFDKLVQSAV